MADEFNPYREWLQWHGQPPNRYQLLALPEFEADPERIAIAGDRAATSVRSFRPGSHAREWSRLLDEIHAAKECLLDPAKKARYDADLRSGQSSGAARSELYPPTAKPRDAVAAAPERTEPREVAAAPLATPPASLPTPGPATPATLAPAPQSSLHGAGYVVPGYVQPTSYYPHPQAGYPAPAASYGVPLAIPLGGHPLAYAPAYAGGMPSAFPAPTPPAVAPPPVGGAALDYGHYSSPPPDPMAPVAFPPNVPLAAVGGPAVPVGTAVAPVARPNEPAAATLGAIGAAVRQPGGVIARDSSITASLDEQRWRRSQRNFLIMIVGGGLALVAAIIVGAIVANNNSPDLAHNNPAEDDLDEPQPIARTVESELPQSRPPQKAAQAKREVKKAVAAPVAEPESPAPASPPEASAPTPTPAPVNPPMPTPQPAPVAPPPPPPTPEPTPPPPPMPTKGEVMELIKHLDEARAAISEQNFAEADESLAKAEALAKLPKHQEAVSRLKQVGGYVKQFRDAVAAAVQGLEAGATFMVGTSTQVAMVEGFPDKVILRIAGMNRTFRFSEMPPGLAVAIADQKLDGADPVSRVVKGAYLLVHKRADDESRAKAKTLWDEAQAGGVDMTQLMPFLTDDYAELLQDAAAGS